MGKGDVKIAGQAERDKRPFPASGGHTESPENSACRLGAGPPAPDSSPRLPRVSAEPPRRRADLLGAEEALGSKGREAKGTAGGAVSRAARSGTFHQRAGAELGAGGAGGTQASRIPALCYLRSL